MSFILNTIRPANLQNWIATNAPGSLKATPRESWRAFLAANGGTGQTIGDMERSYLTAQAAAGSTETERWGNKVSASAGSSNREKLRNTYK